MLGLQSAGGVVVPINTRYKGAEAAYLLDRSRARVLVTVNGFLGNDYVGMLDGHDLPHLEHTVVLRGDVPAGAHVRGPTSWRGGAAVDRGRGRRPGGRAHARTTCPTSSSPPAPPGTRRARCAPTARSCGPSPTGRPSSVCAHGDRYLVINPFFHAFGYKAGIIASLTAGATLVPAERVRHPDRDGQRRRAPDHDAPRPAGDVPDVPQPPRRRPRRSCSRCGSPSPAPPPCRSSWSSG